ncbi:MAG: NUDIX hydrolase [Acidimicrobiia bacterium]|nr:NUDIX hydrolase [Acidimicrobiia bacterium]
MAHEHLPGGYSYCPWCGTPLESRMIGDRARPACPRCEFVHFRNPGVGAAVVIRDELGRILLIRRAEGATRAGLWAVPAGFVDYGEDVRAAAARELFEETGLTAEIGEVLHVASNFHDPAKLTVGVWFVGVVTGGTLAAGDDADEVGFFDFDDLPPLAFETDRDLFERLSAS